MEKLDSSNMFENLTNLNKGAYYRIKRIFDIILSFCALVVLTPVILVIAVIIFIDSPGNPFYIQKRLGLMGKEFNLIKLRSMRLNAEINGPQWAEADDPRITKVGHFIRKIRLDELPQLWNILVGDMSIVGPRPEREIFVEEFSREIPDFPKRLQIKPGLSGLAQVSGGYDITPVDKLKLDLEYINKVSFYMDVKIIFKTIRIIFTGEGAR